MNGLQHGHGLFKSTNGTVYEVELSHLCTYVAN